MCFEDPLAAWERVLREPNLLFVDNVSEPVAPHSAEAGRSLSSTELSTPSCAPLHAPQAATSRSS